MASNIQIQNQSNMDIETQIRTDTETFCGRMYTSNQAFLNDRINEIESSNLPTEEKKLKYHGAFLAQEH